MAKKLSELSGVGAKRLEALNAAGLYTTDDIIARQPVSYLDYTSVTPISALEVGKSALICCTPASSPYLKRKGSLSILQVTFRDQSGTISAVFFNQHYLHSTLRRGQEYYIYAQIGSREGKPILQSPTIIDRSETGGIIPVYRPIDGVPAKTYRALVRQSLDAGDFSCVDILPDYLKEKYSLISLSEAYSSIHFPNNMTELTIARRRFVFDELLFYQLSLMLRKTSGDINGIAIPFGEDIKNKFLSSLPFTPTGAQLRCIDQIAEDLSSKKAMTRMLQGDVGSGKTLVAQSALFACAMAGHQCALMAPTEILARQHFEGMAPFFARFGLRCGLLVGSMTAKQHQEAHENIANGAWDVVIGTHALITQGVEYNDLALVITDEQHRFGVGQRTALQDKGSGVNVLVMSATPIPRTLSLILYGDLDISVIDELPPGRTPVKTYIVGPHKREGMFGFIKDLVKEGRQGYVVCPLIEKSEAIDVSNAQDIFEEFSKKLPGVRVALAHGKQSNKLKQQVLDEFYKGNVDVLVSTTIIEVGVNVPNASFMIIEDAERFGLAQLHQLRGRVGRGAQESFCFLVASGAQKLRIMTQTNDGFLISQKDLEQRGPGDILGTRQSGMLSSDMPGAQSDLRLLEQAHLEAKRICLSPADEDKPLLQYVESVFSQKLTKVGIN
ncbi:MAG: ATP-dependent DNA helicase RecG [Clostridiales bacterium]|nr:ATP-dependent DNA helicase RecG [Clostridiales bacterium]